MFDIDFDNGGRYAVVEQDSAAHKVLVFLRDKQMLNRLIDGGNKDQITPIPIELVCQKVDKINPRNLELLADTELVKMNLNWVKDVVGLRLFLAITDEGLIAIEELKKEPYVEARF